MKSNQVLNSQVLRETGNTGGAPRHHLSLLLASTSIATTLALGLAAPTFAQDEGAENGVEEIVVTGIRSSLRESADIKRRATGVVDGIIAEDMGKFPDSNLAESLQRITGVSINRQNGEGSQVTVRGFGPGFNHVTLNGRSMPTADIPLVGGDGSGTGGSSRSFDFSNLASEGVRALEVYKTGRATIASGGIGATINIKTRKPLDTEGLTGTISAKAVHDTSVDRGNKITPEMAGFLSWSDDDGKFGIGLFGSYSKRDSAAPSSRSADWNIFTAGHFLDTSTGLINEDTIVKNAPTNLEQLISVPRDSRFFLSEISRERLNGQAVVQFNPTDTIRMTADYTYASNDAKEDRYSVTNWFSRPFTHVTFDSNPIVATTTFLQESQTSPKDYSMELTHRATKNTLNSVGFNTEWDASDNLTFVFDAHSSKAKISPRAPMGYSEVNVGMAWPLIVQHSVDYSTNSVPLINYTLDDGPASNGDGIYDIHDVSSSVSNLSTVTQENEIDQFDIHGNWELDDGAKFTFGANKRRQSNLTTNNGYRQILGDWGATQPNDIEEALPGSLEMFCLSCEFSDYTVSDMNTVRGYAPDIFKAISPVYDAKGQPLNATGSSYDKITEDVLSFYGQLDLEAQLANRPVQISLGLRYERTDVTSLTQAVPTGYVIWQGDNDFNSRVGEAGEGTSLEESYNHLLPSLDFSIDVTEDIVSRFSYSKTIARAGYGDLFASASSGTPPGPTLLGNIASGTAGNPGLLPLESDNFDVSVEWYYAPGSYVSIGAFEKRVRNFVGVGQVGGTLFDLRDPTSGAPGTRSGDAAAILDSVGADLTDRNLFAMTALIDNTSSLAEAQALFEANQIGSALDDAFYLGLETDYDVIADANDPLFEFQITTPVNNEEAKIYGLEVAVQHFFGDSGFGVAANYTMVDGDVGFDVGGSPSSDQFALTGLSDTANLTLIYENYGLSARVAYNWRDDFLHSANKGGGFRNPVFVESYASIDMNISYNVTDNIAVSFEAINLTGESSRTYGRDISNMFFARENGPRYYLGARYKF